MQHFDRHRRFQIAITIGTCACAVMAVHWPDMPHYSVIGGVVTNLIWIWE